MCILASAINPGAAAALFSNESENPFPLCDALADEVAARTLEHYDVGPQMLNLIADVYATTHPNLVKLAIENRFGYRLGYRMYCSPERLSWPKALPPVLYGILLRQMTEGHQTSAL